MSDVIEHIGIIEEIDGTHARIRTVRKSACSICRHANTCSSSECKSVVIDVDDKSVLGHCVGDTVTIKAKRKIAFIAVFLGFLAPLAVFIVSFLTMYSFYGDDLISSFIGIVSLAVYYFFLSLYRHKLALLFNFKISES